MKHSSIQDNWKRVLLLDAWARQQDAILQKKENQEGLHREGDLSFLNMHLFDDQEKERHIVGMIIVWSVITLDTLVNHALAESINNKTLAVLSIEYPGKITGPIKEKPTLLSELSKKLYILSEGNADKNTVEHADNISEARNSIVHDKPIEIIDVGDGDVEVSHFRLRSNNFTIPKYSDLHDFYKQCESVTDLILSFSREDFVEQVEINFKKLYSGYRDRTSPHGEALPHHRVYGSQ